MKADAINGSAVNAGAAESGTMCTLTVAEIQQKIRDGVELPPECGNNVGTKRSR